MDILCIMNNLSYSTNCTCTEQLCTYCFCSFSQTTYASGRAWNLQRPLAFKRPKPTSSLTAVRFCCQCNIFYNHFLPIAKQDQTLETVCREGLFCFHPWMCVQPMLQCLAVDFCLFLHPPASFFFFANCLKPKKYIHAKDRGLNFKLSSSQLESLKPGSN